MTDDERLRRVADALYDARTPPAPPPVMALPDLVAELELWLTDDRQWQHGQPANWRSLVDDLDRSVAAHRAVLHHARDPEQLRAELIDCIKAQGNKELRAEPALRRRLAAIAAELDAGLRTAAALHSAWADLLRRCGSTSDSDAAAVRFLALARWIGIDVDALSRGLMDDLAGRGGDGQALELDAAGRLQRAEQRLERPAVAADAIVWLRLLFASVRDPPVLELGPNVHVYQDRWLRTVLSDPGHPDTPPEVAHDSRGYLRDFCAPRQSGDTGDAVPGAFVRVKLEGAAPSHALVRARLTASTLGALGALHGAEPSLWHVDPSHVMFRGSRVSATTIAPLVESATMVERMGVERDRTARVLFEQRERLGALLPVGGGRLGQIAELLRWLRDARSSPSPARLVLCDRTIERFVEEHLVPSWAYGQAWKAIRSVAVSIVYDSDRRLAQPGTPEHAAWEEILAHPGIGLLTTEDGAFGFNSAGILEHALWLHGRLPPGSRASAHMERIAESLRSGRTAAAWLARLRKEALISESRRARTRNALMHGGPIAEATVDAVLPFAEYMAAEAAHHALEAQLEGVDISDYFIGQAKKLRRMSARLAAGDPPHQAMVWT
jgi:hypothetical protein